MKTDEQAAREWAQEPANKCCHEDDGEAGFLAGCKYKEEQLMAAALEFEETMKQALCLACEDGVSWGSVQFDKPEIAELLNAICTRIMPGNRRKQQRIEELEKELVDMRNEVISLSGHDEELDAVYPLAKKISQRTKEGSNE